MSATLPNPSTPQARPGPDSEGPQSVLRRSSRNTTPVRRPGMITTSSISRRPITTAAPASSTRPTSSSNAVPSSRISNNTNSTISNNHERTSHLNLSSSAINTQTNAERDTIHCGANAKINKKQKHDKDNDYDLILNYFGKPFHIAGDDKSEDPITYICQWCNSQVRGGQGSNSNLYSHCDGKLQKGRTGNGCRNREKAIKSGVKLPPTVSQLHKVAQASKSQKINTFFGPAEKFNNVVLNRTLTVWLIRHALPWSRVEDEELQASFHYTQPASQIFKRKWQAKSGQLLYLDLQTSMIERLQLDFVVRKITGSATWRQKFETIALAKGLDLLDLIAGYGIRWNIKYESRKRAYDARSVIDQMLKDEFDEHVAKKSRSRRKDKSKSGHFNGILLDASDWRSINELNEELEVFMVLTKEMEGDGPTGALVLPKYYMLKETLIEKENDCSLDDPLHPMFQKMIKKLNYFPKKKDVAEKILNKHFQERKNKLESKKKKVSTVINKEPEPTREKRKTKLANLFHSSSAKAENDELTVFLNGGDVFEMDEQSAKYPVLSSLARDYLACSASSCSAERTFSAAADVCSSNRGKLLPRTIEMCVSSRMWLKGDVPLTGEFAAADKLLKRYVAFKESKQSKTTGGSVTT
ncbi:hypothetical protein H4Q26_014913 [Puccinia striiformis f. sp. tritici PST-130]|nr:hypothetical protein H4Q26_014913 [Puccinia striiformis f. sp. tritici PST-130]